VDFTPTDTVTYTATFKTVAITVTKATPTVVVTGGLFAYDGQPHAASGFAYGVGGVSDVLSPTLTFTYNGLGTAPVAVGTYNVVGTFAGNSNYLSATNTATLTITQGIPALTWSNPADIAYGTALGATQLNATASVAGTFVYTPPAGTVLNAGANQTLHVDFTPTDTTNYAVASKNVTINVTKAAQTITFNPLPDKIIGDPPFTVVATATSGLLITFTASGDCNVAGNTVTLIKVGTCTVTAHQAGNANYQPALDIAQTFTIQRMRVFLALIAVNNP
jgi:hypothetical protein